MTDALDNVLDAVDDTGLRAVLTGMIAEAGTQRGLAGELGISTAYLSDILAGNRPISAIAERLGYRAVTVYIATEHADAAKPAMIARLARGLIGRMNRSAA